MGMNIYLAYGAQYVLFTVATFFFIYLRIASERAYRRVASKKDSTVNERFDVLKIDKTCPQTEIELKSSFHCDSHFPLSHSYHMSSAFHATLCLLIV